MSEFAWSEGVGVDELGHSMADGSQWGLVGEHGHARHATPNQAKRTKGTYMAVYGIDVEYPSIPDEVCSGGTCRPEADEWCDWHNPDEATNAVGLGETDEDDEPDLMHIIYTEW